MGGTGGRRKERLGYLSGLLPCRVLAGNYSPTQGPSPAKEPSPTALPWVSPAFAPSCRWESLPTVATLGQCTIAPWGSFHLPTSTGMVPALNSIQLIGLKMHQFPAQTDASTGPPLIS